MKPKKIQILLQGPGGFRVSWRPLFQDARQGVYGHYQLGVWWPAAVKQGLSRQQKAHGARRPARHHLRFWRNLFQCLLQVSPHGVGARPGGRIHGGCPGGLGSVVRLHHRTPLWRIHFIQPTGSDFWIAQLLRNDKGEADVFCLRGGSIELDTKVLMLQQTYWPNTEYFYPQWLIERLRWRIISSRQGCACVSSAVSQGSFAYIWDSANCRFIIWDRFHELTF